jgi:lysophospholipid acyltransferase (LPLAT)-like uncharacterized protein
MTVLKPAPVATSQFMYDTVTRTFSAEISSTNGFGRVYDDAADDGLTLVSTKTGKEIVFVVSDVHRDREGDLTHWDLVAVGAPFRMVVFND